MGEVNKKNEESAANTISKTTTIGMNLYKELRLTLPKKILNLQTANQISKGSQINNY